MMDPTDRLEQLSKRGHGLADKYGNMLVDGFHSLALFAIGATIVWSAVYAFILMAAKGHASIEDILLLFIFLELGAMVGIYFKTNHMPVRFLIYVAITALTRMLIGSVNLAHEGEVADFHDLDVHLVVVTGSILLLALAALTLRYASHKYPSVRASPAASDFSQGDTNA